MFSLLKINGRAAVVLPDKEGRWRDYEYDQIFKRDKLSLDLFWIKDQSLTDTDSLPPPNIIATEIADELEAAFDLFTKIAAKPTRSSA